MRCGYCDSLEHTSLECQRSTQPGPRLGLGAGKKRPYVETEDFGHQQVETCFFCHGTRRDPKYWYPRPCPHCAATKNDGETSEPRKFWLCWVEGKRTPVKKHLTFFEAKVEAARLSALPGNEDKEVSILGRVGFFITSLPRKPITEYTAV